MENTSTKCPAQPSSPMSAVIQSVTQTSGARPWALRTPAGMETRDNIDKIKCTFIACQSRKITRSMKIFKAKQTSVFFQWPHPWTDQMQCQCQWQSTNVKQQCHEMILNVNDMQTAAIRIISKMFQFVHLTRPVRRCWCSAGSVGGHHIHAVWSFPS